MSRPRVLLTGAGGRLGSVILRDLSHRWEILPSYRSGSEADLCCDLLSGEDLGEAWLGHGLVDDDPVGPDAQPGGPLFNPDHHLQRRLSRVSLSFGLPVFRIFRSLVPSLS